MDNHITKEEKRGITQELLKTLFNYKEGNLYWKIRKARCVQIGDIAGHKCKDGYYSVAINHPFLLHRIIFLWHYGYVPKFIDHIDKNRGNNKIENLRPATSYQNVWNRTSAKNSSSKYLGVRLDRGKYWRVQIHINGKQTHVGNFKTEDEAALAFNKVAVKNYGEFASLNIIKIKQNPL
jgi:hypothetical protein